MPTRLYLPSSGTPPLASLAVDGNWELSDSLVRLPCSYEKSDTTLTQKSATWSSATTQQWVWAQFQSPQLTNTYDWTTSETISMVIKVAESIAQGDSHLCYVIRVVSGDGATIRGTVGAYLTTSSEYPTSLAAIATRIHSARTDGATNFSSQIGDRIIIEIGHHGVSPSTSAVVYHNYGDPSATEDYALTAGLTTDLCPWVEFSGTLPFIVSYNLVVQDASHTQTASSVSLTQNFALTVNVASHAQTADSTNLSQKYILTSNITTHSQTADNIDLSQKYILTSVKDASHLHTVENTILVYHASITIQNASQAQTSDNITLIQHQVLAINNAQQAQIATKASHYERLVVAIEGDTLVKYPDAESQIITSLDFVNNKLFSANIINGFYVDYFTATYDRDNVTSCSAVETIAGYLPDEYCSHNNIYGFLVCDEVNSNNYSQIAYPSVEWHGSGSDIFSASSLGYLAQKLANTLGLPDLYTLNITSGNNAVNGEPFPNGNYNPWASHIMNDATSGSFSDWDKEIIDREQEHFPKTYYTWYDYQLADTKIHILNAMGNPLPSFDVNIYRSDGNQILATPTYSGTTDSFGYISCGSAILGDTREDSVKVFLAETIINSTSYYQWFSFMDANFAYWDSFHIDLRFNDISEVYTKDSIQVQTSDNITLTQNYILTVNPSSQTQTSDIINLIQTGSLEIQNTTQIQTAQILTIFPVRVNGARDFNGTTDRIDWANVSNPSGAAFSLSAWVYIDVADVTNDYVLCIHDSGDTVYGIVVNIITNTKLDFIRHATIDYVWFATGADLEIGSGAWHNIILTSDGGLIDGSVAMYYDGASRTVGYGAGSGTETAHTGSWSVGGRIYNDTCNFDGKIGEVAVWNRVLTSEEITTISNKNILKSAAYIPNGLLFVTHPDEPKDLITNALGTLDGTTLTYGPDLDFPDYTLTVSNSAQVQTSDNVILFAHYILQNINIALQEQTSDNLILSQGSVIAVQNSIQTQISDNIILTQNFILVVLIATQLMTSDNISIGGGAIVSITMMHYKKLRNK